MKAHCLFEQSGTFKNEFKKLGVEAFDYDILNDYGETDYQMDLFAEIEKAYRGEQSIFDDMKPDDLILAFFPCTRFECQCSMSFRGEAFQMKNWSDQQKLEYDLKLHDELSVNYTTITKLALIAIKRGFRLVIENPANLPHYLTSYWCIKPKIIDNDRTLNGDRQKKPTQFWFIGFDPKNNLVFEPIVYVQKRRHVDVNDKVIRSEIHPQYASRFIKKYLIDYQQDFSKLYEDTQ